MGLWESNTVVDSNLTCMYKMLILLDQLRIQCGPFSHGIHFRMTHTGQSANSIVFQVWKLSSLLVFVGVVVAGSGGRHGSQHGGGNCPLHPLYPHHTAAATTWQVCLCVWRWLDQLAHWSLSLLANWSTWICRLVCPSAVLPVWFLFVSFCLHLSYLLWLPIGHRCHQHVCAFCSSVFRLHMSVFSGYPRVISLTVLTFSCLHVFCLTPSVFQSIPILTSLSSHFLSTHPSVVCLLARHLTRSAFQLVSQSSVFPFSH